MALDDLIRPRSRQQIVYRMLASLSTGQGGLAPLNFAPTNYVPGDPLRTLLELEAEGIADVERTVEQLGRGGYLSTASGEWLDALVESHYGLTRQPSVFAQGLVRFTAPITGGLTVPAGMIVGTVAGQRYVTRAPVELAAGASGDVIADAEGPGSAYNAPIGTITVLHTPLPGLSVTNPAGWLLQAGADEEGDDALRERASLRWAELGGGATRQAYEYWALSAHASVDRVTVLDEHPRGQGTVDVVIWGTGGIGADVVNVVNAFVQDRRPLTADVQVYAATERTVTLSLTLYAPGLETARAAIESQVMAGLAGLQGQTGIGGRLYASQIIEVAMLPAGVLDATLEGGRDIVLAPTEALTLQPRITWRGTP